MRAVALVATVSMIAAIGYAQRRYVESPAAPSYREGMKLLTSERWTEAAVLFERAVELDTQYALAFYGLGRARIGQKQYVAAVNALERCAALYRDRAVQRANEEMSLAQQRQDQIHELREHIRNIMAGPRSGALQLEAERAEDQIEDIERSMRDGISDLTLRVPAFVSLSLGSAQFRRGSMADAEREYRHAIKANPRMGEAYNNLAVVQLLTGRAREADHSVKEAEKRGFRVPAAVKHQIREAQN